MLGEIFGEQGLIVLALALILLFGGTKIPQLARSLGQAKKEFGEGMAEGKEAEATAPVPDVVMPPLDAPVSLDAPTPVALHERAEATHRSDGVIDSKHLLGG